MKNRFSPRGGAVRVLVVFLGVATMAYLGYLLQLPKDLRAKEAAAIQKLLGTHYGDKNVDAATAWARDHSRDPSSVEVYHVETGKTGGVDFVRLDFGGINGFGGRDRGYYRFEFSEAAGAVTGVLDEKEGRYIPLQPKPEQAVVKSKTEAALEVLDRKDYVKEAKKWVSEHVYAPSSVTHHSHGIGDDIVHLDFSRDDQFKGRIEEHLKVTFKGGKIIEVWDDVSKAVIWTEEGGKTFQMAHPMPTLPGGQTL